MIKKRLLIIGYGDIARRAVRLAQNRYRIFALVRDPANIEEMRASHIIPVLGDLDRPETLQRIANVANIVLHMAPPPASGQHDSRTANLLNALSKGRMVPQHLIYISTSGIYGDCAGQLVSETQPSNPQTNRAIRRADAERQVRRWGRRHRVVVCMLRAPGIYAADRLPLERLKAATPAIVEAEDSYSNHIHADDLARIALIALSRGKAGRSYNASDDYHIKMGDYFDLVADHFGLPRPPRVSRDLAQRVLPAIQLSFMMESRRLSNVRLHKELKVRLRYGSVIDGLKAIAA